MKVAKGKALHPRTTVEALVTPDVKRDFADWCRYHDISQREAAGEAIQLFMDYKRYNFKQLQDHENSPLWVKLNQILQQQELNGQGIHELTEALSAFQRVLLGGSDTVRPSETGDNSDA